MPRFQTDDTFGDSLPAKKAGTAALGLYYLCGLWCARYLTDGHVPTEVAADYGTAEWVRKLVDAGLFVVADGGYLMPLYLNDNPSAEKVLRERQAKAERQAKWLEKARKSSSRQRRVSGTSNRPSNESSGDASIDTAPPLPSPKGEGVDAAPRSGGAAPPTRQIKTTSGRLLCETHHQEIPEGGACKSCAADRIAANVDDDLDHRSPSRDEVRAQLAANRGKHNGKPARPDPPQRPPLPPYEDIASPDSESEAARSYALARQVIDVLDDREEWLNAARKHLAELGEDFPGAVRTTVTAAELYLASRQPDPPPAPEEE